MLRKEETSALLMSRKFLSGLTFKSYQVMLQKSQGRRKAEMHPLNLNRIMPAEGGQT